MFGKKSEDSTGSNSGDSKMVDKSKALEERVSQEIKVHKMPAPYVSGNFDLQRSENAAAGNQSKPAGIQSGAAKGTSASKSRQTGMLIMLLGLVVVAALGYFAYSFLSKSGTIKNFSLASLFGLTNDGGTKVTDNKLTDLDNISNIPIVNEPATNTPEIIDDGNQDNASGTEAIASTTPDVGPIVISPEVPTSTIANAILIDTDNDGLNNDEELLIGTDPNNTDSDFDGYEDLFELSSLYDPAQKSKKLSESQSFKTYSSQALKYSLLYPVTWEVRASADNNSIIFSAPDQSFFQLVIQDNAKKQSIKDWYNEQFNTALVDESVIEITGGEMIDNNGLLIYLTDSNRTRIYTLSYTPINENSPAYKEVFIAMIKSLSLK